MQEQGGWERFELLIRLVADQNPAELRVFGGVEVRELPVPEGVLRGAQAAREATAASGIGAWFGVSSIMHNRRSQAGADFDIRDRFNWDHEPAWDPPLPAEVYARDFESFPRDARLVPDWLLIRLAEFRAEVDEAHSRELARAQAAAGYTLGSGMENPEVEAPLVARLLARGCDPNVLERRGGDRPLLLLARASMRQDMNPLWDVFFTHPGLDFTRTSARGDSVYRFLLRHRSVFAELIGRLHEYMDGQGQPIPRPGEDLRDNFPV